MAKHLTPAEVAAVLRRGTFEELVDVLEDRHLECKAAPYQLEHDRQKYELAKDVSMIVNRSARSGGEGGHLLLGVRTDPSQEYHADVVTAVSPFERGLVNPKQYLDVVHDWLVPPPEGVDVEWFPSAADAARGIVAITVPPQPRDRWPCIVGKVIDERGKRLGVSVSYVERHGEHGVEWTPAEFQRLLREGARADVVSNQLAALSEQVARLSEQVQRGHVPAAPPGPSDAAQGYGVRLGMAVTAADLRGGPVYALAAAPIDTVTLPTLFRGPNEALPRLLASPPRFRVGGWDMAVRGELNVVEGRLLRGIAPGSKILECWSDGTLIHVTEATGYLCWGPKTRGDVRRINPIALAESTTLLFATLAESIYTNHAAPRPTAVRFSLSLQRLDVGGRTMLSSGGIRSAGFEWNMDVRQAPGRDFEWVLDVGDAWTPGEVAYSLSRSVYLWFGFTEDQIPYAADEQGVRRITREKILADAGQ